MVIKTIARNKILNQNNNKNQDKTDKQKQSKWKQGI